MGPSCIRTVALGGGVVPLPLQRHLRRCSHPLSPTAAAALPSSALCHLPQHHCPAQRLATCRSDAAQLSASLPAAAALPSSVPCHLPQRHCHSCVVQLSILHVGCRLSQKHHQQHPSLLLPKPPLLQQYGMASASWHPLHLRFYQPLTCDQHVSSAVLANAVAAGCYHCANTNSWPAQCRSSAVQSTLCPAQSFNHSLLTRQLTIPIFISSSAYSCWTQLSTSC